MTAMIELTPVITKNENSTIFINVDSIIAIFVSVCNPNQAEIECDDDACYHVKESVQDIIKALGVQVIKVGSKVRSTYNKRKSFRKRVALKGIKHSSPISSHISPEALDM